MVLEHCETTAPRPAALLHISGKNIINIIEVWIKSSSVCPEVTKLIISAGPSVTSWLHEQSRVLFQSEEQERGRMLRVKCLKRDEK